MRGPQPQPVPNSFSSQTQSLAQPLCGESMIQHPGSASLFNVYLVYIYIYTHIYMCVYIYTPHTHCI